MEQALIYGIGVLGDGATIRKLPLFNILGSSYQFPTIILVIVDCSKHMSTGGKKAGEYITKRYLPIILGLDPNKKLIDLFTVDGASNAQKAGRVVEVVFPGVTVVHGTDHVSDKRILNTQDDFHECFTNFDSDTKLVVLHNAANVNV